MQDVCKGRTASIHVRIAVTYRQLPSGYLADLPSK